MDRFKFRVWNNFINKYTYFDSPVLNCGESIEDSGLLFKAVGKIFDWGGYNNDIEQCTGLKDESGKLIYEEDIVETNLCSKCLVLWDEDDASFGLASIATGEQYPFYCSVIHKVLGNIHENEDLLEEK